MTGELKRQNTARNIDSASQKPDHPIGFAKIVEWRCPKMRTVIADVLNARRKMFAMWKIAGGHLRVGECAKCIGNDGRSTATLLLRQYMFQPKVFVP